MAPKSEENAPISSLGIKTPKNMFNMFYSGYMWLKDRAEDDGAEGLWRIHDDLYDFTEFIERHPGGEEWLLLTKVKCRYLEIFHECFDKSGKMRC